MDSSENFMQFNKNKYWIVIARR